MNASQQIPNAVDVSQASELTGLSKKAIRRRLERGTLGSVKVGGKRMIPISELTNHELLEAAPSPVTSATTANSHVLSSTGGSEPPTPAAASPVPTPTRSAEVPSAVEPSAMPTAREPSAMPSAQESPAPAARGFDSPAATAASPEAVAAVAAPNGAAAISPAPSAPAAEQSAPAPDTAQPAPAQPAPVTAPPTVTTPLSPAFAAPGPGGTPGYPAGQAVPTQALPGYPPSRDGSYPARGPWSYWYEYPAVRWLVVILVIALVALLVWLLAIRSNGSDSTAVQAGGGPVGATQADLVTLSQELHQPIYWAGTQPGTRMELTETNSSYAYIRYLTQDSPVGDPSPDFLTVGTYPSLSAYANLRSYAQHSRAKTKRIQNGGLAVVVPGSPTSVYFAYPHEDVQVEVYDPHPQHALELVQTGVVRPVTASTTSTTATTVTPTETTTSAVPTPTP
jgi:excisionase family DNA binding protein